MVAVAGVGGRVGRGAQALIELLAIEESGPVSFRLLGFITRDLAVLIAAVGALQLLRRTEENPAWWRLTLSSPVRILPKASFLDCNWRMLTLGVLIVSRYAAGLLDSRTVLSYQSTNLPTNANHKIRTTPQIHSLLYPSLLSLPFYLAYLSTLAAWTFDAFPLSSPAASERRMNSNRLVVTSTGTGGLSSRKCVPPPTHTNQPHNHKPTHNQLTARNQSIPKTTIPLKTACGPSAPSAAGGSWRWPPRVPSTRGSTSCSSTCSRSPPSPRTSTRGC